MKDRRHNSLIALLIIGLTLSALVIAPARIAAQSPAAAAAAAGATEVIIVLPFENVSPLKEYNWVGASFADAMSELLNVPGLVVASGEERELAYKRLRLPLETLPSRATAIKVAREARATLVVLGTYDVTPTQGESAPAEIRGTARVIKVNEGRLTGELMADGRWGAHQWDFGGPLKTLQTMQGRLTYQVLYQRDQALAFSLNQFLERATKVPPRAFESYVKGVMTADSEKRSAYLQNAVREYAKTNVGATYPQATFELGNLYFGQGDSKRAAEQYTKIQKPDRHYAEAAFYAALSYWRLNDFDRALAALLPLTNDAPLTSIYNNAGAISLQAARDEKRPVERDRLMQQANGFLSRAVESAPSDPTARFNYAYALLLANKFSEAVEQLRPVITANPKDGEAYFLFAKALERMKNTEAAAAADNEARRNLQVYAKWQTDWEKSGTASAVPLRLRVDFNRFEYYDQEREKRNSAEANNTDTQDLLAKAREMYTAGQDDEALAELRRVLIVEPMSAEAFLMIGRIQQRRGELDHAIGALKTAIFWNNNLIDAHILVGRIFLERGDRATAMSYARNAVRINSNNPEALALQRQVDTGTK